MAQRASSKAPGTTADRVWTVAAQLFREKGYHAATTRELADRLEITRASLYYHVSKKEDLLYGICLESLRRVSTAVEAALEAEDDPVEQIRALIRCHITSMLTDLDMHATMLLDLQQLQGEQLNEVLQLRGDYEATVDSVVAAAKAAGALRSDISDKNASLALLNLLNWTITWYRPEGRLRPEELADVICDIYLDGTRPR